MGARYEERASRFGGAVLWTWCGSRDPARPVLPDGCMDLLWAGDRLLVAGPDTRAFTPAAALSGSCSGIRFAPGTAPALLGVPAHELRDRRVALDALWPGREVRGLTERIAAAGDPAAALEDIALRRAAGTTPPTRSPRPSPRSCGRAVPSPTPRAASGSAPASSTAVPSPPSATAPRPWPGS